MGKLYKICMSSVLLFAAGILTGCTERPLSIRPDDGLLTVNLVWPGGQSVAGAQVWLYDSRGEFYRMAECPSGGYSGRVPADTYTVLVVNSDCSNADCEHYGSWRECCIQADRADPTGRTLQQVGRVFCTGTGGVTVKHGSDPTEVTLYPKNVVKKLHFDIDSGDIADIADMEIVMTGIVPSVLLIDGSDAGEPVGAVEVTAQSEDDGSYSADMSVFGWRGGNMVTVTIRRSDSSTVTTLPQDLSDQLAQLPDEGGTVYLVLVLPDGSEIELTVTVKDWESGTGSGTVM